MRRTLIGILGAAAFAVPPAAWAQSALDQSPPVADAGSTVAAKTAQTVVATPERAILNGRVFDRVWSLAFNHYYDPSMQGVDWKGLREKLRPRAVVAADEEALYAVLNELMAPLNDAHARVLSPKESNQDRTRDRPRAVLGLMLAREENRFLVEDVRPGSPAEAAEVGVGWEVVKVDGQPFVSGATYAEGVPVEVEFLDEARASQKVMLTPRMMPAPERRMVKWAAPDVLVLRFDGFERGTARWIREQIEGAPKGTRIVLDLRANRGGYVFEARNVLSCFLPEGEPWAVERPRGRGDRPDKVRGGCGTFDAPLVVMVGPGSRSAAELVSGVLQERGRAVVVGQKSAGDVLVAREFTLPDGGRLNLSVSDVRTAGGKRLEHEGVTPDIVAETTRADRRAGKDPALDAAVEAVRKR